MLNEYSEARFAAENASLLLIDHQSGIMQLVHDYAPADFRNNVIALGRLGKTFNIGAVKATKRRNLIMAGVTLDDVCLAFPAMQATAEGFNVYAVVDASGAHDVSTQQLAVQRLVHYGVTPVTWMMVAAELQRDWRNPTAAAMTSLFHDRLLNYGMLMDSFARTRSLTAAE